MSVRVNLRRSSGESGAIIIDDQSDRIGYLGDWSDLTSGNKAINNGTLKELDASGGGFFFEFTGSQVQVYGVVRPLAAHKTYVATSSTYSVDGNELNTFTSPNLTQEADGIMLFNSGSLPINSHQLTVSVDSASEDYPYLLDYIVFIPAPTLSSNAISFTVGSSSASSSSSSLVNTALSFSGTSTSCTSFGYAGHTGAPQYDVATSHSSHVGPIVGGVIGGVALLAILFGLLFWCLKRRKAQSEDDSSSSMMEGKPTPMIPPGGVPGITPYMLPRDYNGSSANFVAAEQSAPLAPRSVFGGAEAYHANSGKVRSPDALSPYSNATFHGEGSGSRQPLLAGPSGGRAPSEVSSGSGSGAVSTIAFAQDEESAHAGSAYAPAAQRARSPKTGHASHSGQLQAPRPVTTVHADSGLRFPRDADPDESFSQATTQPPAYTPFSES
ncbi:hypothetical protein PsYK624_004440 [Phanerochaete sordida]|uniref:Uncharacterized protein n=1 Tax=Phanerochaete sordida TaxID=48140 RepID=A0A9P3FXG9_9APHY|nr:hypothetical protein PsYK624_004440 [Phanerochaete sordida]